MAGEKNPQNGFFSGRLNFLGFLKNGRVPKTRQKKHNAKTSKKLGARQNSFFRPPKFFGLFKKRLFPKDGRRGPKYDGLSLAGNRLRGRLVGNIHWGPKKDCRRAGAIVSGPWAARPGHRAPCGASISGPEASDRRGRRDCDVRACVILGKSRAIFRHPRRPLLGC